MRQAKLDISIMSEPDGAFVPKKIDISRISALQSRGPLVCLVGSDEARELLGRYPSEFQDRSNLAASKGIPAVMLDAKKVPVYLAKAGRHPGKLVNTVRTVLRSARSAGRGGLFVFGLAPALLAEVLRFGPVRKAPAAEGPSQKKDLDRVLVELLPDVHDKRGRDALFLGTSAGAERVRRSIMLAAGDGRIVLLEGEPGTGKDFVAKLIHEIADGEFFAPHPCATMKLNDLQELLSRAGISPGREVAARQRYTLYLDEVARLAMPLQIHLRRVLQQTQPSAPVKGRVIVSSSCDLCRLAGDDRFDWDLYYLLQEACIYIPPLRERPEDVPALAQSLWATVAGRGAKPLSPDVIDVLARRRWPENVSGLRMVLRRLSQDFGNRDIGVDHLRAVFAYLGQATYVSGRSLVDARRAEVLQALREAGGHLQAVEDMTPGSNTRSTKHNDPDMRTRLDGHIEKLQRLCSHPLDFGSETLFSLVSQSVGTLNILSGLLQSDPKAAAEFWRKQVATSCRQALTAIFEENRWVFR